MAFWRLLAKSVAFGASFSCHVKCLHCGATYNGKTGKSNAVPITIDAVVSPVIALVITLALSVAM